MARAPHSKRSSLIVLLAVTVALAGLALAVDRHASAGRESLAVAPVRPPTTRNVTGAARRGPLPTSTPRTAPRFVCTLRPGQAKLPPGTLRGLIDHLEQYPTPSLATPQQRLAARRLLTASEAAVRAWPTPQAAARAGYVTITAQKLGTGAVHYFHAERGERRTSVLLDPSSPKALIYANTPGRPLALVGVMFSVKRGEHGPTPGGPVTRWHSHLVCAKGDAHGVEPRADGTCPEGTRLRQGSEMMHLWFTNDLRSAFALRAPEPELCRDGLLPHAVCR